MRAVACTDLVQDLIKEYAGTPFEGLVRPLNPQVCIHVDDALKLARWIVSVDNTRRALDSCPWVQLVDE